MLKIYKTSSVEKKLKKVKKMTADCWLDLIMPTQDEIDKVVTKTGVDKDLIMKMLDDEELPRVEQSGNGTLVVIDTPYLKEGEKDHKYKTYPLGIIITNNNYFITISPKRTKVLNDFKRNLIKDFRTAKKTRFLIQILLKTSSYYLKALKDVNKDIALKEEVLKKSTENKDLIDLLEIEKTLVYFITSLQANSFVLDKIRSDEILSLDRDDKMLLEDAIIENKQCIETSIVYRDILDSTMDTYGTIISNNLNVIMKFLAGITIVFSIPTMISSFLGMNVPLGVVGESEFSFLIICIISCILSFIIACWLKNKNML